MNASISGATAWSGQRTTKGRMEESSSSDLIEDLTSHLQIIAFYLRRASSECIQNIRTGYSRCCNETGLLRIPHTNLSMYGRQRLQRIRRSFLAAGYYHFNTSCRSRQACLSKFTTLNASLR